MKCLCQTKGNKILYRDFIHHHPALKRAQTFADTLEPGLKMSPAKPQIFLPFTPVNSAAP